MYKFLINKGQTVAFVLGAGVSILFAIVIYLGIKDRGLAEMSIDSLVTTDIFNFGIQASIGLIAIAVLILLVFALRGLFTNFKGSLTVILGLAVILGLFGIFYAMSTPDEGGILGRLAQEFNITDGISKFISASIKTTLTLLGLALLIWVVSELRNAFK